MRRRTAHFIRLFLGSKHWKALWQAYRAETGERRSPAAGWPAVCAAILIAGAPGILTAAAHNTTRLSWLPTAAIGICTVLAILIRHRLALPGESGGWRRAFRLTHTSAALGCIPAVLVYLLIPNALPDRRGELAQAAFTSAAGPSTPLDAALVAALCIAIAVWAAVTEEFIYRGLLVGVVRRFAGLGTQWQRDILAVFSQRRFVRRCTCRCLGRRGGAGSCRPRFWFCGRLYRQRRKADAAHRLPLPL